MRKGRGIVAQLGSLSAVNCTSQLLSDILPIQVTCALLLFDLLLCSNFTSCAANIAKNTSLWYPNRRNLA